MMQKIILAMLLLGAGFSAMAENSCHERSQNEDEVFLCEQNKARRRQECIDACFRFYHDCRKHEERDQRDHRCVYKLSLCSDDCRWK